MVVVAEPGGDVGGVSDKKKAVVVGKARILWIRGGYSREEGEHGGCGRILVLGNGSRSEW